MPAQQQQERQKYVGESKATRLLLEEARAVVELLWHNQPPLPKVTEDRVVNLLHRLSGE